MTRDELALLQALPLDTKILYAQEKVREWYDRQQGKVVVSFSGGKDSTVLLHLVRITLGNIPAVFVDTGLEFPEIRDFIRSVYNVTWLKPRMNFRQVIGHYGYPVVSKAQAMAISRYRNTTDPVQKHRRLHGWSRGKTGTVSIKHRYLLDAPFKISDACCDVMKKGPLKRYQKATGLFPFVGTMATDSKKRKDVYLKTGCNSFDGKTPMSKPLSIWTEADIWEYLHRADIPYCKIYDMGYERTGCVFCMFGLEKDPDRFVRLKETHPQLHSYCMNQLGIREVLDFMGARS